VLVGGGEVGAPALGLLLPQLADLVEQRGLQAREGEVEPRDALGGGVAANGPLRAAVAELCESRGVALKLVPGKLCTDNAAMIASAARWVEPVPYPGYLGLDAYPTAA